MKAMEGDVRDRHGPRGRERERTCDRERERESGRQREREGMCQRERDRDSETEREIERETDRETERQAQREREREDLVSEGDGGGHGDVRDRYVPRPAFASQVTSPDNHKHQTQRLRLVTSPRQVTGLRDGRH